MSDYIQESGAGTKVIRAAFSAALSEREKIDIARKNVVQSIGSSEKEFLSFLDFNPMGYPMGDELVAIAQMYSESSDSSETTNNDFKMTEFDIALDDVKANLYDKFFNISPNIDPFVSLYNDYPILNQVYEKFLRHSEFAGEIGSNSKEMKEAEDFLFPKNEEGVSERSNTYKLYNEYLDKSYKLELSIVESSKPDSTIDVDMLRKKLQLTKAEWITLGKKREVEKALDVLSLSDAKAGYDDERNAFIELLESRLRYRLRSGPNYATVTILPLKPLLDPKEGAQWQRFALTVADIERYVTPDICQIFNVSKEELSYVLKMFKSASMQYIRVFLNREWLSKDFLKARYWKNSSSILSDGSGSGELPTLISSAFFIKSVKFEMHQGINIREIGDINYQDKKTKEVFAYDVVQTPLIKALIQNDMVISPNIGNKLITQKVINNLNIINNLQSQEKLEHTEAEKIKLPSKLLQATFRPDISNETILQSRVFETKLQAHPDLLQSRGFETKLQAHSNIFKHLNNVRLHSDILSKHVDYVKQNKKLSVSGKIKHNNALDEKDLNVKLIFLDKNDVILETENIQLSRQSDNIVFNIDATNTQHVTRFEKSLAESIIIELTDKNGNNSIMKKIEFIDESKNIILNWNVSFGSMEVILSSEVTPTLFAYALQLLPKSPNPDESLFNS